MVAKEQEPEQEKGGRNEKQWPRGCRGRIVQGRDEMLIGLLPDTFPEAWIFEDEESHENVLAVTLGIRGRREG